MEDFFTTSRQILLFLEAELPPADDNEKQDSDSENDTETATPGEENAELPGPQADAPAAPPPAPVELASPRECMYVDTVLKALMFDFKKVPTKALVVFDMTNPEQILHYIQKITNSKPDLSKFKTEVDNGDQAMETGSPTEPMLHRQKQILAQLMLKALKYDSKQLTVDSGIVSDKVTPETSKQIQKELSILLAV